MNEGDKEKLMEHIQPLQNTINTIAFLCQQEINHNIQEQMSTPPPYDTFCRYVDVYHNQQIDQTIHLNQLFPQIIPNPPNPFYYYQEYEYVFVKRIGPYHQIIQIREPNLTYSNQINDNLDFTFQLQQQNLSSNPAVQQDNDNLIDRPILTQDQQQIYEKVEEQEVKQIKIENKFDNNTEQNTRFENIQKETRDNSEIGISIHLSPSHQQATVSEQYKTTENTYQLGIQIKEPNNQINVQIQQFNKDIRQNQKEIKQSSLILNQISKSTDQSPVFPNPTKKEQQINKGQTPESEKLFDKFQPRSNSRFYCNFEGKMNLEQNKKISLHQSNNQKCKSNNDESEKFQRITEEPKSRESDEEAQNEQVWQYSRKKQNKHEQKQVQKEKVMRIQDGLDLKQNQEIRGISEKIEPTEDIQLSYLSKSNSNQEEYVTDEEQIHMEDVQDQELQMNEILKEGKINANLQFENMTKNLLRRFTNWLKENDNEIKEKRHSQGKFIKASYQPNNLKTSQHHSLIEGCTSFNFLKFFPQFFNSNQEVQPRRNLIYQVVQDKKFKLDQIRRLMVHEKYDVVFEHFLIRKARKWILDSPDLLDREAYLDFVNELIIDFERIKPLEQLRQILFKKKKNFFNCKEYDILFPNDKNFFSEKIIEHRLNQVRRRRDLYEEVEDYETDNWTGNLDVTEMKKNIPEEQ